MSNTEDATSDGTKASGWEKADRAMDVAGNVAHGIGWGLTKLWGVALIAIAVLGWFVLGADVWWLALLIIAYGVYLVLPGSKWVVW